LPASMANCHAFSTSPRLAVHQAVSMAMRDDSAVSEVVLANPAVHEFLRIYEDLVSVMRPGYLAEGKRYVTIAIGCTGGKHRSVATAVEIAERLRSIGIQTLVVHRDLGKE